MEQIKRLIGTLSIQQRWTILISGILVAAGLFALSRWQTENNFRPLYNSLAAEDAASVVQKLKEGAIPYRLSNNNGTISVPEEKVAELRLEMAGAGLPKSGRLGFEIFDKTNFGMTDFAEHINYRRALEGELERSVMSLSQVEQARVHISFPQESVYLEVRQPAKASVLIKIRAGMSLPDTAMPAITNLVSSAVEGLVPEAVSVLDMRGNLLNRPKRASASGDDSSEMAMEYKHRVEQDLLAKLDSTLEPLVGSGRFRTAVSADCDMTRGEQSEESLDPTRSVMVTSQKTDDATSPMRIIAGIPGTASNLPPPAPATSTGGGGTTRHTESVNYQTSRTVKHTVTPQGAVKRLSISVLIDHDLHWEGSAASPKRVLVPPSPERLKVIHDLVAAASGFDSQRGDQLIVESLPFESTLNMDPPAPSAPAGTPKKLTPIEQMNSDPKLMMGLAAIMIVIFTAGFFIFYRLLKKSRGRSARVRVPGALPQPADEESFPETNRSATIAGPDTWAPSALAAITPGRVEVLKNQLRETVQRDGEICVGVLRSWLKEERT